MHQFPRFGDNQTAVSDHPDLTREMKRGTELYPPTSTSDQADLAADMTQYVEANGSLGSVPRPGHRPRGVDEASWALFVDKLGARLAFERTGVRLYDGLLAKLEAYGGLHDGPERDDLERIRDQELEHFHALVECTLEIGGDPTAITPSADVVAQVSSGVGQVIGEPRADLLASLEAVLVAELADNEGWDTLRELARGIGQDAMAGRFEHFAEQEREHLAQIRAWIAAAQGRAAPATPH